MLGLAAEGRPLASTVLTATLLASMGLGNILENFYMGHPHAQLSLLASTQPGSLSCFLPALGHLSLDPGLGKGEMW